MWIQTGVTVRKRFSGVVTSLTLTFVLWPWPFAWTLHWPLVITPENFMMIRWWEHSQKGVTDRQTDGQTENTICRAAWSQLKRCHRQTDRQTERQTDRQTNGLNKSLSCLVAAKNKMIAVNIVEVIRAEMNPSTDGQREGHRDGRTRWNQNTPINNYITLCGLHKYNTTIVIPENKFQNVIVKMVAILFPWCLTTHLWEARWRSLMYNSR